MASRLEALHAFVQGAPPGELTQVVSDIKTIDLRTKDEELEPAFEKHNHEQFATVKLPGASQSVVVSSFNALGDGRYYDPESKTSFQFDHTTQKASSPQSYIHEAKNSDVATSLLSPLSSHVPEHFPSPAYAAYPTPDGVAIVIVSNKYSPSNFWNGRWRSLYHFSPSASTLTGTIKVDVHYYEDGNVRLLTEKPINVSLSSTSAASVVKEIATLEKKYQEELNREFAKLSEGAFKSLRRHLPVTRQKVDWDKISGYKLGQDIGGGGEGARGGNVSLKR